MRALLLKADYVYLIVIVFIGLFQLYQRHFAHSNLRECYQINLGVGEILNQDLCLSVYLAFFF